MTLAAAVQMMGTTSVVPTVSNGDLVNSVIDAQQKVIADAAAGAQHRQLPPKQQISIADGLTNSIRVRPISALLELALGTSLQQDPAIATFARRWAILRHLGIYDRHMNSGELHLDQTAIGFIGPNQRRTLSEEIGIGFGIVAAKEWCRARNPGVGTIAVTDFDIAMHAGQNNHFDTGDRQPDYVLKYPDPNNPASDIYELLEVKGTVSRSNAIKQLGRASTQLASVTVNNTAVTGLATSTVSSETGIQILAVDPESPRIRYQMNAEEAYKWRARTLEKNHESSPEGSLATKLPEEISVPELAAKSTNANFASLAAFSGLPQISKKWHATRKSFPESETAYKSELHIEGLTFRGTQMEISIPGHQRSLAIFAGIDAGVHEQLESLDAVAAAGAQRRFWDANHETVEGYKQQDSSEIGARVAAISSNGAVLSIRTL